jgi:hypothetical protein
LMQTQQQIQQEQQMLQQNPFVFSEMTIFDQAQVNPKYFTKGVTIVISANFANQQQQQQSSTQSFFVPHPPLPSASASVKPNSPHQPQDHQKQQEQHQQQHDINEGYQLPFVLDFGPTSLAVAPNNINPDFGVTIRNSNELLPNGFREKQLEVLHSILSSGNNNSSNNAGVDGGRKTSPSGKKQQQNSAAKPATATTTSSSRTTGKQNGEDGALTPEQLQQLNFIQNQPNNFSLLKMFPQLPPLQHSTKPGNLFVDGKKAGFVERNDCNQIEITLNADVKAAAWVERIFRCLTLSFHRAPTAKEIYHAGGSGSKQGESYYLFDVQVKAVISDSRKGTSEISRVVKIVSPKFEEYIQPRPRPCLLGTSRALKAHHLEKQRSFTMGSQSQNKSTTNISIAGKNNAKTNQQDDDEL